MDEQLNLAGAGLRWCAILRICAIPTLLDLGVDASEITALMAHGWLVPPPNQPHALALAEPIRRATLELIRREQPQTEINLQERAVTYFTDRLLGAGSPVERGMAEESCLSHLGSLHDLFIESMEWTAIIPYTLRLQQLQPPSIRVEHWIAFFAAYADLRGEAKAHGLSQLEHLLADDSIDLPLRLRVLHACHIAWIYLSRYDRALDLLREAHTLARRLGDRVRRSYVLLSIGQIYNDLYDHRRALRLSRMSLRLARAEGAPYREAHALYEVGNNAMQLGRWDEAMTALSAAEAMFRQFGMTRRLAMVSWAQGMISLAQGNYIQCEQTLVTGLTIAQAENTHNALTAMDILAQLGLLSQVQGNNETALGHFRAAIALTLSHQLQHWRPILRARVASLLAQSGAHAAAEAEWRAAVAEIEALREDIAVEDVRVHLFGTTPYVYESLVLFLLEQGRNTEAFAYVERARSRAFLDLLANQEDTFDRSDMGADPAKGSIGLATIEDLQRRLGPREVVLEYFTTSLRPGDDHWMNAIPRRNRALLRATQATPATVVFVITHDSAEVYRLRDTPYNPQADPEARALAPDLDSNKLRPSAHSDDPILDMLRIESQIVWLSQRLLAPVERHLQGSRRVYIIPHGSLHYVPFSALRRQDGGYLLDAGGPAIIFAPSASVLIHALRERPTAPGRPSLSIGYNGPAGRRLDYAEREAAVVADLVGGDTWIGPEAKSARLIGQGQRLRWLHITGHTIFESGRPRSAGL
ncbi:MAG: CHAT domain-containing protein, partial [Oscillochloris sp.]|nr:CHAT domain-containing protein [Oscillochloris sp.]